MPVRSASPAPIACLNVIGTTSFDAGLDHVFTVPSPRSGCGSENAPLTRWPVAFGFGRANAVSRAETNSVLDVIQENLAGNPE